MNTNAVCIYPLAYVACTWTTPRTRFKFPEKGLIPCAAPIRVHCHCKYGGVTSDKGVVPNTEIGENPLLLKGNL